MAELDPKTATLREAAEAYATKKNRKNFVGPVVQYFKDIADEPGSAMRLFEKDAEGRPLLSKTFGSTDENAPVKTAMQNIRQVGLLLKESFGPDTPEYKLLPDKSPNTDLNNRIFGRLEPPKNEAQIAINPDRIVQSKFFSGVAKYLDDPATRPAALAIIFNLNTGLRPNAVLNLTMKEYMPDTGAVYIETDVEGTKGRPVNIPLNPVADSILQESLKGMKPGDFFFRKPSGARVTTTDINKILRAVKVDRLMYDQATKTYYDSLHPKDGPGKTGSPLLRNVHSSIALDIGIPQERTAYLQGRSLKSASKGATGELATYQKAFPGNVGDLDREFASQISSFWGQSASDAGFDIQSKIPVPETRITTQTAGYEKYFELPVTDKVPEPVKPTATAEAASGATAAEIYPDAHEKLGGSDKTNFLTALGKKFGKKTNAIIAGLTGGATIASLMEDAGAVARDVAIESAAVAAKVPLKVAGAIPMILEPSSRMAGPELTQPSREEQDMARMAMEPSDMLDESTEDMERMAIADAGFVSRNREPEAAPAQEAGFINR